MELVKKYFPELDILKIDKLIKFSKLISEFNQDINVISRKDIENIEINHILHSLAIAKFINFNSGSTIIDIGTGGGFPGIPLAIIYSDSQFLLVDSIGKKIKVVQSIIEQLELANANAINCRIETIKNPKADFIISRAVAPVSRLFGWSKQLVSSINFNQINNGFILLKGGEMSDEISNFRIEFKYKKEITEIKLKQYFDLEFFETKKLIYIPV